MQHDCDLVGDVVAEAEHDKHDVILYKQSDGNQHARPSAQVPFVQLLRFLHRH